MATMFIGCVSCISTDASFAIIGDTLLVVGEHYHDETQSTYLLQYDDNRISGAGEPISFLKMIYDRNAFEVGDKVKIVKVEE